MRAYILIFIVAVSFLGACQRICVPDSEDQIHSETVSASVEQFYAARTTLGTDNEILWSSGDEISVFKGRTFNDEYQLKEGFEGMDAGEFLLIPSLSDGMISVSSLPDDVAFYPYVSTLRCGKMSDEKGYVLRGYELPATQNWTEKSFDRTSFPMVAVSGFSESFAFRNIFGILKICLKGSSVVTRLTVSGNNDEVLAGEAIVYAYSSGSEPEVSIEGASFKEVILDCGTGVLLDQDSATSFLICLPPTEFAGGFTVSVECADGQVFEFSTSKRNSVLRSMILRMPEIDLNAVVDDEDDKVIGFEDPVVENAFVSEYDLDGDGALSVREASTIKSVDAFFFGSAASSVRSLNDLRYFTSLNTISDDAFNGCDRLESVLMPSSLKNIGDRAFADCISLMEVTLNDGLEQIGAEVFRSCYNLSEISLPYSLESIAESCFKDCINLESFSGWGAASDGRSLVDDDVLIAYASSGQARFSYLVPDTVTRIGDAAFYCCRNIVGISFHSRVRSIGAESFSGCGLLADIGIPDGLESIGELAFERCYTLTELALPQTLKSIGYNAFAGCSRLNLLRVSALNPPVVDVALIDEIPDGLEVFVPKESLSLYVGAIGWRNLRYHIKSDDSGDDEGDINAEDGAVNVLQTASEGRGIDIVLMGDAFSADDIAAGTYDRYMKQAMNAFFSVEPYQSYREFFNVYSVNVVSERSGYNYGTGTLNTFFGEGTSVGGDDDIVMDYALKVLEDEEMDDALIIVLMNRRYYAGTCYMYYPTDGDYGRGLSIAYFPLGTDDDVFAQLLQHEAGGHGFAKLYDEYYYEGRIPSDEINDMRRMEKYGWARNVDLTSDWDDVKWSRFLNDLRYESEGLGVYEGACTYRYGAYRPTLNSIMNENVGGFNAPSREAIWYRINKLAYGKSWEYDYEVFVEYDSVNLQSIGKMSMDTKVSDIELPQLAPPVIRPGTWRDLRR